MSTLHRLRLLTTICFLALFIFTSNVYALFGNNVKKANEFMQAGMYPQAIALLEEEINQNPASAEAHFQLGICYINQSTYRSADERFSSAIRLQPDYGYQIGNEYKKAADFALKKSRSSEVKSLYDKAIEYDPSLKKGIAQTLFQKGKQTGNDQLFSFAVSYDSSLNNAVADYYYANSQTFEDDASLSMLEKASEYNGKYRINLNEKKYYFLEKASQLAKVHGKEKEAEEYKNKAIKYLGKDAVFKVLPDYKDYEPGKYSFSLKAGEQTDHWITTPVGEFMYDIKSSDYMFKVLYKDGDIVDVWKIDKWPQKDPLMFKIIAVTDQKIILTLKELK